MLEAWDQRPDHARRYQDRMRRVLAHIDAHPDGDLSVAALSAVAAFSPFHFQRQFAACFGIGVQRYVQLVRLKRASWRLAFRDGQSVLEVALDSGYAGPEAFARAFRQRVGQSPTAFRDAPDWKAWTTATAPLDHARRQAMTIDFTDDAVRIVDFAQTPVAVLTHRGDPATIGDSVRRFIAWRKAVGLVPPASATFNRFFGDPDQKATDFRLDLCAARRGPVAPNDAGVVEDMLPATRCAVLRQVGGSDLKPAIGFLYRDWLPRSGEEAGDAPLFVERVRFFPDVAEHGAIADVYLPLR